MPVTINGTSGISTPAVTATTSTTTGAQTAGSLEAPTVTQGSVATERVQQLAAVSTTSGTFVDFTIPTWAKKITVALAGVSTNGSTALVLQLGTGGSVVQSGYAGACIGTSSSNTTNGTLVGSDFALSAGGAAADVRHGIATLVNAGGNAWVLASNVTISNVAWAYTAAASITLAGVLDRVRITSGNRTDAFDAGSVSILIEG